MAPESGWYRTKKKVMRYYRPDDRKRSLGAGIIIKKILNENGLRMRSKVFENEKPVVNLFFNISHAGDYVVGVLSDCEMDAISKKR